MPAMRRARKYVDGAEDPDYAPRSRARRRRVEDVNDNMNTTYAIFETEVHDTLRLLPWACHVVDDEDQVLYVLGGAEGETTSSNFHAYRFKERTWENLTDHVRDANCSQKKIRPLPCITNASGAIWSDDGKKSIMLFGGHRQWGELTNEIIQINLDELSWSILPVTGMDDSSTNPEPCECASMVIVGDELFVFGGILSQNKSKTYQAVYSKARYFTSKGRWNWEIIDQNIPSHVWPAGCQHLGASLMYDNQKIFFVAGWNKDSSVMPNVLTSSGLTFMYDIQADLFFQPLPPTLDVTLNTGKVAFDLQCDPQNNSSTVVVCWIPQNANDNSDFLVPQFWRIRVGHPASCQRLFFKHDLADEELDWKFSVVCGTNICLFGYDNTGKRDSGHLNIAVEHSLDV